MYRAHQLVPPQTSVAFSQGQYYLQYSCNSLENIPASHLTCTVSLAQQMCACSASLVMHLLMQYQEMVSALVCHVCFSWFLAQHKALVYSVHVNKVLHLLK